MLTAILVTVLTLVVIAIAVFVILRLRSKSGKISSSRKTRVRSISSVGVAAHAPNVSSVGTTSPSASSGSVVSTGEGQRSRFVAVGVIIGAVFAALFARLFGLQVLSSSQYQQQAASNLYTTVKTPAPRGVVYDAEGIALISNRQVETVLADAEVANNHDVLTRLSGLLGIPYDVVKNRILDTSSGAQSQRVVASDVSLRNAAFISEHIDAFPGVSLALRTARTYPYGALGAHFLGYAGTASESDLENVPEGQDIEMGDMVGKSGIEQTYNSFLAGAHGERVLVTDAQGTVQQVVRETDAEKGSDVYLTVSAKVQYIADAALKELVEGGTGSAATLVCLDVETGGVVALSNYPTYEPGNFIGGISQEVWDRYQTEESHYPLMNRAVAGTYPAASCFKAFSGLAGLTYGFADSQRTWNCTGMWTGFGDDYPQRCWLRTGHGPITFRQGVVDSCDTVFYEIAKGFYQARDSIGLDAMQDFIKEFGYGSKTNVDLSGEADGRIPTPEWKQEYYRDAPEQAQWLPGDMSNMAIGQGYVLVTPIQVACAYAAVATGRLLKPHFLKEVRNSAGEVAVSYETQENGVPEVTEENLRIMRDALHGVATENSEVSIDFGAQGIDGAAKTGTAQVAGKDDYAWFACYAPYENPRFALALCIEEGGSGGSVASPVAARVMRAALDFDAGTLETQVVSIPAERVEETPAEEDSDAEDE